MGRASGMTRFRASATGLRGLVVLALLLAADRALSSDAETETADGNFCNDSNAVCVGIRVRPATEAETSQGLVKCVTEEHEECQEGINRGGHIRIKDGNGKENNYKFDGIFSEATNGQVYDSMAAPLVPKFLDEGINVAILAYGATGSGKTYTMGFDGGDGIMQKFLKDVYARAKPGSIKIRVLEAYGEGSNVKKLYDLVHLESTNTHLGKKKKETPTLITKNYAMAGFSERPVETYEGAVELIRDALARRTTGATAYNDKSSRSHCIIQISCLRGKKKGSDIYSTATMVDLAGNEKPSKDHGDDIYKQGVSINQALGELSQCIISLGGSGSCIHPSYALANFLKSGAHLFDKLDNGKVSSMIRVIGTVRQDDNMKDTTDQTLEYLDKFRKLKVSAAPAPKVDVDLKALKAQFAEKEKELALMREQLEAANALRDTALAQKEEFESENESLQNKIAELESAPRPETAESGTGTEPLAEKKESGVGTDGPMTTSGGVETELTGEELERLQDDVERKEDEKQELLRRIEADRRQNDLLLEQLKSSENSVKELRQNMDDLVKAREALTSVSVGVETDAVESGEMDVQTDPPADSAELETQTDDTDSETEELEASLRRVREELDTAQAEAERALQSWSETQIANKELMQKLAEAEDRHIEQLGDIKAKHDAVEAQLRDAQRMHERSQALQEELESKLKDANDRSQRALEAVAEMKVQVETLQGELAAKEDQLKELKENPASAGNTDTPRGAFGVKTIMTALGFGLTMAFGLGSLTSPALRGDVAPALAHAPAPAPVDTAAIRAAIKEGLSDYPRAVEAEVSSKVVAANERLERLQAAIESLSGNIATRGDNEVARSEAMKDVVGDMTAEITELKAAVTRLTEQGESRMDAPSVKPPVGVDGEGDEPASESGSRAESGAVVTSEDTESPDGGSGSGLDSSVDSRPISEEDDASAEPRDESYGTLLSRPHDGVVVRRKASSVLHPRERQAIVEYPFHTPYDPDAKHEPVKDIDDVKRKYFEQRHRGENPFWDEHGLNPLWDTERGVRDTIVRHHKEQGFVDIWDTSDPAFNDENRLNARIKWHVDRNLPHGVGYFGPNRIALMKGQDPVDIYNKAEGDVYGRFAKHMDNYNAKKSAVEAATRDARRFAIDPHGPGDHDSHRSAAAVEYRKLRGNLEGVPDGLANQHRGFGDLIWPGSDVEKTTRNLALLRGHDPAEIKYVPGTKYQEKYSDDE